MTHTDRSYKRARTRGDLNTHFDTIVIGSGAGGLTAAALLALDGQKVLVLERHAVLGGCLQAFKRTGFEWDVGLHYMGEVHRQNSGLARLFSKVTQGKLQWARMPDIYNRIVVGDNMYDYVAGVEPFRARMKDYFPHEATAIDRYIKLIQTANRAAKAYFGERALPLAQSEDVHQRAAEQFMPLAQKTVLEVLNSLTTNQELIAVFCGHYGDYSMTPDKASFAVHAMVISHYIDGASYPVGGAPVIAEHMANTVEQAGGHCLVAADVTELVLHQNRVIGVRLADGHTVEATQVIGAGGIAQTYRLLKPEDLDNLPPADQASYQSLERSQCYSVLNIGLDAPDSELGMHPANIWAHPSSDLVGNNQRYLADPLGQEMPLYFISLPSSRDPSWPDRYPGHSTIDICGLTDWSIFEPFAGTKWQRRGSGYDDLKARITERMLAQIERFYPQTKGHIAHTELATPLSFNHFLNRDVGDFMSYAQTPQRFAQRWMRAHSPISGLFHTGQDVTAAGVSGAMVGALVTASAVLGRDLFQELHA